MRLEPASQADSAEAFERFVRTGLARVGLEADEQMLAIISAADAIYGPYVQALLDADLTGIAPEPGLDVSRGPTPTPDS